MTTPASTGPSPALEVRAVDALGDGDWDRWLAGHPEAGPFHASAWSRVLARAYGHRPRHLMVHRGGRPAALIPLMEVDSPLTGRRGVCLPFADACGLLRFEPVAPLLLVDVLRRQAEAHGWRHVEVRGSSGLPPEAVPSVDFFTHDLDLSSGAERVHGAFDPSVRRALRKAQAEGVQTEVRSDREAMQVFCALHARTRRRHGLPPQPKRFFEAIRDEFLEPGLGAVVLGLVGGRPVAASVFLHGHGRAVYKFGASDERAQATRAGNLVMWRGIQWLATLGVTSLSFGRTSCSQDGLRRYKRGWGAVESVIHYHKLALPGATWARDRDRAAGRHAALFSRLPLALNRLLGAALYPHLD